MGQRTELVHHSGTVNVSTPDRVWTAEGRPRSRIVRSAQTSRWAIVGLGTRKASASPSSRGRRQVWAWT